LIISLADAKKIFLLDAAFHVENSVRNGNLVVDFEPLDKNLVAHVGSFTFVQIFSFLDIQIFV
jgi:hypothetical protein